MYNDFIIITYEITNLNLEMINDFYFGSVLAVLLGVFVCGSIWGVFGRVLRVVRKMREVCISVGGFAQFHFLTTWSSPRTFIDNDWVECLR